MDPRLHAPLDHAELVTVAGLAAGYGFARAGTVSGTEFATLGEDRAPVGLAVRLTHRVLVVGTENGLSVEETAAAAARRRPVAG